MLARFLFFQSRPIHSLRLCSSLSRFDFKPCKKGFHFQVKNLHLASSYCGCVPYLRWRNNIKITVVAPSRVSTRNFCEKTCRTPKDLYEETHPVLQSCAFKHWFKNWQDQRKHKLTASTFAGAIGMWPRRRVQLWLEKIGSIEPFAGNLATCWSNIKEEEALVRYKLITGNSVIFPEFQIYREKNPEDNWLAASADGIVYGLPSNGILEIKCPFFNGDMSKAYPWSRIPLHYVPQAQGLMEILDRDWMDFYVWTPKGSSLFRLNRDEVYWDVLKVALSDFWWNHVQPSKELCCKSVIKNPLIELRSLRPAPRHDLCSFIVYESKRVLDNSKLLIREIEDC